MVERTDERDPTLARLEDFSNAVFAIAITLLVFELTVPHLTGTVSAERLWRALGTDWPRLFSYILSFVLVGQIWINYQRMMGHIHRPDHWLLWLNLALLLMVSGYAFPTSLLGEYALKPGAQTVAAVIYGGWLTVSGLVYNLIWWHAVSKHLVAADLAAPYLHRLGKFYWLGIATNLVVTLLALLNVWISLLGFFCLAVFYILPPPRVARVGEPTAERSRLRWAMPAFGGDVLDAREAGEEEIAGVETEGRGGNEAREEMTPGERHDARD